jgi:diguanylate cyclase (GGDEF)-like protein
MAPGILARPSIRLAAAAALLAAVLALLYYQALDAKRSAARRVGIALEQRDDGRVAVQGVVPGLPAERAGLRAGDLLLAIDGAPIGREGDYDRAASRFDRNLPVTYLVERDGASRPVVVRPGAELRWGRLLVTAVSALAHLALALLMLFQKLDDRRGQLLALLATAVALELALPSGTIGSPLLGVLAGAAIYLLNGLEMATELHLASSIPQRHSWVDRFPWVIGLFWTGGLLLGATAAFATLAEGLFDAHLPLSADRLGGVLDDIALPLWAFGVAGLLGYQALRHPGAEGRHQAGLVLLGTLPWCAYVVAFAVHGRLGRQLPDWLDAAFPLLVLCYPLAVFVAIFRYQLLDLELVVRRSLLYAALTSSLLLVFYAALGAGGAMFSQLVDGGRHSVWVVSAATLLLGLLFAPLRRLLQAGIERRFFPERQALRQQLTALAGELAVFGKLPVMGKHLVTSLSRIFGVRPTTLLIADPQTGLLVALASTHLDVEREFDQSFLLSPHDPGVALLRGAKRPLPAAQLAARSPALSQRLTQMRAAVAVPILGPTQLVGVLLLGEKATGESYRAEELELLNLLAHHVATVFENARLFESATYESLTGLLRREAILEQLERELQRAVRYRRPLAIGMADLDHFKDVNDRFGHLAGDALLKRVAQTIQAELRSTDAVGRYGGEEFLLVLPETDLPSAVRVAEKVRGVVERTRLPLDGGETVHATVSIGLGALSELPAGETPTVRDLIALADRSLYRAKKAGRNRVEPAELVAVAAG